jgi:hypothetical protein
VIVTNEDVADLDYRQIKQVAAVVNVVARDMHGVEDDVARLMRAFSLALSEAARQSRRCRPVPVEGGDR